MLLRSCNLSCMTSYLKTFRSKTQTFMFGIQTALAFKLHEKYGIVVLSFVGECYPYRKGLPHSGSMGMKARKTVPDENLQVQAV